MITADRIDAPVTRRRAVESQPAPGSEISAAYDGTTTFMRLLRDAYWGPEMLNLGYYPWYMPIWNMVRPISSAQRDLAYKLVKLMEVKRGDNVIDIACGRGCTSYITSTTTPAASVVGVDLLPENIQIAKLIYPTNENFSYQVGDAQNLPFPDQSFDKALCCEAAFHFPDRAKFMKEAARVLKPGGRMAICDFVWRSEQAHEEAHRDQRGAIVRQIWQYEDMATEPEYVQFAEEAGLKIANIDDWSKRVTITLQKRGELVTRLARHNLTRKLVCKLLPQYATLTDAEWERLDKEVKAHRFTTDRLYYKSFVFEKR